METTKLGVHVPSDLYRRLKVEAAESNKRLKDVVIDRLERSYDKPRARRRTQAVS